MVEVFVHHVLTVPIPEAEHDIAVMRAALDARKEVVSLNPRGPRKRQADVADQPAPLTSGGQPAEPAKVEAAAPATPPPVRGADGQSRPAQPKKKRIRNRSKKAAGGSGMSAQARIDQEIADNRKAFQERKAAEAAAGNGDQVREQPATAPLPDQVSGEADVDLPLDA